MRPESRVDRQRSPLETNGDETTTPLSPILAAFTEQIPF